MSEEQEKEIQAYLLAMGERLGRIKILQSLVASQLDVNLGDIKDNTDHSSGFEEDEAACPSILNPKYIHYYATQCFRLTESHVEDMARVIRLAIREGITSQNRLYIDYLLLMVLSRLEIRLRQSIHRRFNIVSLGIDCLSRLITTKWGFKLPRTYGEATLPFDLTMQPFETLKTLLSNNFAEYLDDRYMQPVQSHTACHEHKKYGIQWSHELGPEWAENNYQKLKDRYSKRIANFYDTINKPKTAFFVLTLYSTYENMPLEEIRALVLKLQDLGKSPMAFFCLALGRDDNNVPTPGFRLQELCGRSPLFVFENPSPYSPVYHWWNPETYVSDKGYKFELSIVNGLTTALNHLINDAI